MEAGSRITSETIEVQLPEQISESDFVLRAPRLRPVLLVWRCRRWIGAVVLRYTIVAALLALVWPNHYLSTTRIVASDEQTNSLMATIAAKNLPSSLGSAAGDLLGGKDHTALYLSMLRSRTIEDRIINQFDLRKVYWDKYMRDARKDLEKSTTIDEDRKSGVITISVLDRSKTRAAGIAGMYVDELNRVAAEMNTSAAHRERLFIEGRLHEVKLHLDDVAKQLSQFSSKNTAIDIKEQGRAMLEGAAAIQGQIIAAESELSGLQQIYSPNNVRIRSLQSRITELKNQLRQLGGTDPNSNAGRTEQNPDLLGYPSIRDLPQLGFSYAELYRELKVQETVYELLTQQYEMAKIEEAKELPSIRILDKANVAELKASPHRILIVLAGALFAFCLGSFVVLIRDSWKLRSDADPLKVLISTLRADVDDFLSRHLRMRALSQRIKKIVNTIALPKMY